MRKLSYRGRDSFQLRSGSRAEPDESAGDRRNVSAWRARLNVATLLILSLDHPPHNKLWRICMPNEWIGTALNAAQRDR
jgi:hypothetical protein